jgi:hypothetical protein
MGGKIMPMRVNFKGVVGKIIKPYGRFQYGNIVDIIKIKIAKFDYFKSRVCVSDGMGIYWLDIGCLELMPSR